MSKKILKKKEKSEKGIKRGIGKRKVFIKLMVILLIVILLPIFLLGYLSYQKSYDMLKHNMMLTSQQNIAEVDWGLDEFFNGLDHNIASLASNKAFVQFLAENQTESEASNNAALSIYKNQALELLKNHSDNNSDVMYTYFGTKDKDFYIYPEVELPDDFDPTGRVWYEQAIQNKEKVIFSEPYQDVASGDMVITAAKAVVTNGQVVGVIGADVNLKYLTEKLSRSKIGKTGYVAITDPNGIVVTHPNKSMIGTDITNLAFWELASTENEGFSDYTFEGEHKFLSFVTNERTGWKLLGSMDERELLDDTELFKQFTFSIGIGAAMVSVIISFFIGLWIDKPLNQFREAFAKAATGDLTVQTRIKSKDEFGEVGNHFNLMMENIRNLVQEVVKNTGEVENTSQELSATMEEITSQTQIINSKTQEIAAGMEEASASTEEISSSAEEMSRSISQLAESANNGNLAVKEIEKRANEIKDSAVQSTEVTKTMYSEKQERILKAIEDGKVVIEIEKMAEVIADIAGQTNLLALNAAIEASRAGEHGKGFAVVADEIRKLAEQSTTTVSEIQKIVNQVKESFENLSDQANEILRFIEEKVTADYQMLEDTGNQYQKDADFIRELFEEFAANTEQISNAIAQINQAMDMVASTAEQSASNSQEISGSTSDVVSAIESVNLIAQNQTELSQKLNQLLQKFIIS